MRRGGDALINLSDVQGLSHKPGLSHLGLQILIQYNGLLSIMYAILIANAAIHKVIVDEYYTEIFVLVLWSILEPIRIFYGYSGNLRESVPRLSTFLLITVFPQLAIITFLGFFQPYFFPIDRIMSSLMFIAMVVEFFLGAVTIRTIIRSQTAQFMRLIEE